VTLGGGVGGVQRNVIPTFFCFLKHCFLMHLEGKLFDTKQDNALKDTLFLIHLIFQRNLGQKISHQKIEKCHMEGGGVRKVSRII
jgi:hypothetical protein